MDIMKWVLGVGVAVYLVLIGFGIWAISEEGEYRQVCDKLGGVEIDNVCIKPVALLLPPMEVFNEE